MLNKKNEKMSEKISFVMNKIWIKFYDKIFYRIIK